MSAATHRRDVIRNWLIAEPGLSAKHAWERWLDSEIGPEVSYTAITRDFKILREEWGQIPVTVRDDGEETEEEAPNYQEALAELLEGAMGYFRQAQLSGQESVAREWVKVARSLLAESRLSGEAEDAKREGRDQPVLDMIDQIMSRNSEEVGENEPI